MISKTSAPAARVRSARFGEPDILADGNAERNALDMENKGFRAGSEIAFFVENRIVRQFLLEIRSDNGTVCQNGTGVIAKAVPDAVMADKDMHIVQIGQFVFQPVQFKPGCGMETVLQEEVLRRITG